MTEFATRRKQLMQAISPNGIIILPSAPTTLRNGDYEYPYRQQSDFYYLTGFEEPESITVLCPKRDAGEFILFNRPKDRSQEIWEGIRAGQEGACKQFGADESFPIHSFKEKLIELLQGREEIYYAVGTNKKMDKTIIHAINELRRKIRSGVPTPSRIVDISPILHDMRLIKSPSEINLLRKAAEITADAHLRAMQICKPGMNEYELEAELLYVFQKNGARFPAYTSIVGQGPNSCILHYNANNQAIQNGSVVLIDAGCEYQYYAADVTRTFPANGKFSAEQRAVYEVVLAAQLAGIDAVRPGTPWNKIEELTIQVITQGLVDIGLLKGSVDTLIETQAYFPFYMHRVGHWLGLDVHDAGSYKQNGTWRTLKTGMVRTIEPGIYISADIPNVPERWHGIGIRIEDDVLVTATGNEVLSHAAPKTIVDIESVMRG